MFSHVYVGVKDFERALGFYRVLMAALGNTERFCDIEKQWAGWQSHPEPRPLFVLGAPYDGADHAAGNGQMVAFDAATREQVDQLHALMLEHGAVSEGAPGLRPQYHPNYYGAYFRDTEGNKVCVVCHAAPV